MSHARTDTNILVARHLGLAFVIVVMTACIYAGPCANDAQGLLSSTLNDTVRFATSEETQWMILLCLAVYLTLLLVLRAQSVRGGPPSFVGAETWRVALLFLIGGGFFWHPRSPAASQGIVLLIGVAVGCGSYLAVFFGGTPSMHWRFLLTLLRAAALLLGAGLVWKAEGRFSYNSARRWAGPWDNPDISGILAAVGAVIATGLAVFQASQMEPRTPRCTTISRVIWLASTALAVALVAAMWRSYSRGAWLAFCFGSLHLFAQVRSNRSVRVGSGYSFWQTDVYVATLVMALAGTVVWHARYSENITARRASSVVNPNDFSSRNRLAAWEGALQMMAQTPCFGVGWNQTGTIYENFYLPPKLGESAAIEMNDYLMMGASVGIPALFCFAMYLGRSLRGPSRWRNGPEDFESCRLSWLKAVCRAGALVFVVGFWFDGGLFKLPTATMFCVLLELGRVC